jgi:TolB protein
VKHPGLYLWPAACCLAVAALASCGGASGGGPDLGTNRVAFIGTDGVLYTARGDGSNVVSMSQQSLRDLSRSGGATRVEDWPTWSPDGRWLAFMRMQLNGEVMSNAGVFVISADGQREISLPSPDRSVPIYMTWSPDSRYLTMLLQQGPGLMLHLADMSADPPAVRSIDGGAPLFTSWSPDSSRLIIHADGDRRAVARARLSQVNVRGTGEPEVLPLQPGSFATPAWSPDGSRWAFAAAISDTQDGLYLRRGQESALVARGATPAFIWAPHESKLAFGLRDNPEDDLFAGLSIADGAGNVTKILDEPVAAFFWSPDGRRLAYFTPGVDGLTVVTADAAGKDKHELATFAPTQDFGQLLSFFDQYAQSHSIWSPDSRQVLFAGIRTTGNGSSNPNQPHIYAAMADGSGVKSIADGRIAFWSLPPR